MGTGSEGLVPGDLLLALLFSAKKLLVLFLNHFPQLATGGGGGCTARGTRLQSAAHTLHLGVMSGGLSGSADYFSKINDSN